MQRGRSAREPGGWAQHHAKPLLRTGRGACGGSGVSAAVSLTGESINYIVSNIYMRTTVLGTGKFFSNAIFCTKFGTALKSRLNELK